MGLERRRGLSLSFGFLNLWTSPSNPSSPGPLQLLPVGCLKTGGSFSILADQAHPASVKNCSDSWLSSNPPWRCEPLPQQDPSAKLEFWSFKHLPLVPPSQGVAGCCTGFQFLELLFPRYFDILFLSAFYHLPRLKAMQWVILSVCLCSRLSQHSCYFITIDEELGPQSNLITFLWCIAVNIQALMGIRGNLVFIWFNFLLQSYHAGTCMDQAVGQAGCFRDNASNIVVFCFNGEGRKGEEKEGGREGERGRREICMLLRQWTLVANRSWLIAQNRLLLLKAYIIQVDPSAFVRLHLFTRYPRKIIKKKKKKDINLWSMTAP